MDLHTGDVPRVLVDDLNKPNGVVLSADQKTLFVSDTGAEQGRGDGWKAALPRTVYAFDLVTNNGDSFAHNNRVFCVVDNGIPDGLKLDLVATYMLLHMKASRCSTQQES